MKVLHIMINIKRTAAVTAIALAVMAASCQKELDYTRPADAGTFEKDKAETFTHLTDDDGATWVWDATAGLFGNKFGGLIVRFFKDSTANVYGTPPRGLIADLQGLRVSGTLAPDESEFALELIEAITGIPDAQLRGLLDNPANADFKEAVLYFLPNYEYFNSLGLIGEEGLSFDINGPVQLSLTFHNSELLASLKQTGGLDFDLRVMKSSKDSVTLDGYYANNANKKSMLFKKAIDLPIAFVMSSRIALALNPTRANVSMRSGGATIPTPQGYRSGLDYFYRAFDQTFTVPLGYGYVPNGSGANVAPDVLKNARILRGKSYFNGTPNTAPAGTVLFTLTVVNTDGSTKDVEFIKN